ncbi:MAG: AAA family ATPase, partial [Clostridiales bacterium]|nr:AAA family ATPase [Clostridiales bacterium]
MNLIHGDHSYIERGSSSFEEFVTKGALYIDKTRFVEHVLDRTSKVLLITRPRRMGKSLNLDTLYTFLDCAQNTGDLFKALYVAGSSVWGML